MRNIVEACHVVFDGRLDDLEGTLQQVDTRDDGQPRVVGRPVGLLQRQRPVGQGHDAAPDARARVVVQQFVNHGPASDAAGAKHESIFGHDGIWRREMLMLELRVDGGLEYDTCLSIYATT